FDGYTQREQQQASPIGCKIWSKKVCNLPKRPNSDSGIDLLVVLVVLVIFLLFIVFVVLIFLHNIFNLVVSIHDRCALTLLSRHIGSILQQTLQGVYHPYWGVLRRCNHPYCQSTSGDTQCLTRSRRPIPLEICQALSFV